MNKWPKIRSKIYNEKLNRISGLFTEVSRNVNSGKVPRDGWTEPLETWTANQITEDGSLGLSLQEYLYLKNLVEDLNQHFVWRNNEKDQVILEFKQEFQNDYFQILQAKECDLKLEVTAELIEEKQFPLDLFLEWYNDNWHLPSEQFNEELGNFWGDVWKHAAGGAGLGAAAGGIAGGVPTGGIGTFAGAGLGSLAGGALGGLYGGSKNLLQRVWQYRQTQRNFEQTKDKALESLKKLRDLAKGFDMNPNFTASLDSLINQLGTVRAYRMAQGRSRYAPTDQESMPGKAVDATKQVHPGWAELGKAGTPTTPPEVSPTGETPEVAPEVAPPPPEALKPKRTISPEHKAALLAGAARRRAEAAKKAAAGETPPTVPPVVVPPVVPPEPTSEEGKITNAKQLLDIYKKALQDKDVTTLYRIGTVLTAMGHTKPEDMNNIDFNNFNELYNGMYKEFPFPEDAVTAEEDLKAARTFADKHEEKELDKEGTPKEMETKESPIEKKTELIPDKNLESMDKDDFKNYIRKLGFGHLLGRGKAIERVGTQGSNSRKDAIKVLKFNIDHPEGGTTGEPTESVLQKYRRMLKEGGRPVFSRRIVAELPIQEKVEYVKSLLRS